MPTIVRTTASRATTKVGSGSSSITSSVATIIHAFRHFLLLLILLAFICQQQPVPLLPFTSSNNGPQSSFTMALPVSMMKSLYSFYPLNTLFRTSSQHQRRRPSLSIAVMPTIIENKVKNPDRYGMKQQQKQRQQQQQHQQLTVTRQDELLEEAQPARFRPHKYGTLKLCPPGGRSFFEAFELACPMRKRRKRHVMLGFGKRITDDNGLPRSAEMEHHARNVQNDEAYRYRPANISEIMRICCASGCEFSDFFPHCGPFSMWK